MKKLALILALALATTPAFARAGEGGLHRGGMHTGRGAVFMAIVTSIEAAAMATVTTDIMATLATLATTATTATMATMATTAVIPEPLLA